jgi:uracil-DNA glycosylase
VCSDDNVPRSMAKLEVRERRQQLRSLPHIEPLCRFVDMLRLREPGLFVPDFDPLDGGIDAKVLFLFEKPGRKAESSGFFSRNNDSRTAEYIFDFMQIAAIPREKTALWNVVPWWNGKRKVTDDELRRGLKAFHELLPIFDKLTAICFVGRKAQRAMEAEDIIAHCKQKHIHLFCSLHPSPIVEKISPNEWKEISEKWKKVLPYIS